MLTVISPAKKLDCELPLVTKEFTNHEFKTETDYLIKKLQKKKGKDFEKMMHISPALGEVNYVRYQNWSETFSFDNSRQAAVAFQGDVYKGMNAEEFTKKEFDFAQNHLRILSGLYGLLRPLDLMMPYRLEMGTRWEVTPKQKNLYNFWGNKLTDKVNEIIASNGTNVLLNLASNEYFKALNKKEVKARIVTPVFKEYKNGDYKIIMTYAKQARGLMSAYVVKNKIEEVELIKGFDLDGYMYSEPLSSEDEWVFVRG